MTLATAINIAKQKAAGSPKWTRAIERAGNALQSGELCVTLLAHDALVTSPRGSYRVNGKCECEAARRSHAECYHGPRRPFARRDNQRNPDDLVAPLPR